MAKKKKAKAKAKRKAKPAPPWKVGNSLVTDFLKLFRLFLTKEDPQDPKARVWNWPPQGQPQSASLGTIRDVVDMLNTAYLNNTPPPPGTPGTYLAQVAAAVIAYQWPTNPRYKPKNGKPYKFEATTVNLYEIGQVADLMLQAINGGGDGGGGGGGSRWPPVN